MQKAYSLDYSIERDTDRLKAVEKILDSLVTNPTNTELEQMASYILYGKDEEGKNAIQRGDCTDSNKRYNTFTKTDDKLESLDAYLEAPLSDQRELQSLEQKYVYLKKPPVIKRPKYDKKTGELIDAGDSDIPTMTALWERIDYLEKVLAANEGKIEFKPEYTILPNSYECYKLKHMIINLRQNQYYLKDMFKPTLHFYNVKPPQPQMYNWSEDTFYWMRYEDWENRVNNSYHPYSTNVDDYESKVTTEGAFVKWMVKRHTFDYENPKHLKALMDNYSALYMQSWDKPNSWARTLLFDFDRYSDMAHLSPVREYILYRRIDGASPKTMKEEIMEKFGIYYHENYISQIAATSIPKEIAKAAKRHRLLVTTPIEECKQCFTCKRHFPRNTVFFNVNTGRKDHFASNCKECERKKRIARGVQSDHDRRNKEPKMYEVQTGKTNT